MRITSIREAKGLYLLRIARILLRNMQSLIDNIASRFQRLLCGTQEYAEARLLHLCPTDSC